MAKNKNNVVMHGMSGKLWDMLVFKQKDGQTIVAKSQKKREGELILSEKQKKVRETFLNASRYAKGAVSDPAIKALYESIATPGQTAYNLALADFFKAPEIGEIDISKYNGQLSGSIKVLVTDNCMVKSVRVKIEKADGQLVEIGDATASGDGLHWLYENTVVNGSITGDIITVLALDLPGHSSSNQKTI